MSKFFFKNYLNTISFACSTLIPFLVTGPFIPDLIISLLSFWFLYYTVKNKIYYIFINKYFYIFLFFWMVCLISSLLSENMLFSLKSSFFYIRIAIFALLISYLIDQDRKILDYFYFSFLITFSILIFDGYLQRITGYNLFGYLAPAQGLRISSFFHDELILGSYVSRLLPFFIALFFVRKNKSKWESYLFPILLILLALLIFFSGERAALFFYFLSFSFLLFFLNKFIIHRIIIFLISTFLILFFIIKNQDSKIRFLKEPSKVIENINLSEKRFTFFTPEHDSLIKTAWNMFLDKPILGHGPNMFRIKCSDNRFATGITPCRTHPHNFYIQLLSETGILGFFFLLGIFITIIYLSFRNFLYYNKYKYLTLSNYQICLLSGLLITVWPITTNGNFFNNYLMIIYGLQVGFFKNFKSFVKKKNE